MPQAASTSSHTPRHWLPPHRVQGRVFLFTGHIVDAPDRPTPRFPPSAVPTAAHRIAHALDEAGARPGDLALTQGAAGGDLLFCHAALQRHMALALMQPFDETSFVQQSVAHRSADWLQRYQAVRRHVPRVPLASAPLWLGPLRAGQDAYARCNAWLLATALAAAASPQRLHVIALWNGEAGDGPGGTAHLVGEAEAAGAQLTLLHPLRPRSQRQAA